MPRQLLRLSDRLLNTPLLIHPAKAQIMLATETALSVAEAEKILGVSPKETRLEALAQRASAGPEFGAPGGTEKPDAGALIQEGWKRAIANANRQFARA